VRVFRFLLLLAIPAASRPPLDAAERSALVRILTHPASR
jgi:hypothetical protein